LLLYLLQRPKPEQVRGERWLVTPDAIRRTREIATPLGNLPEQIDHTDFRQTETGRIPFRSQWSRADYRVTYTVTSEEKTVEATRKNIKVLQGMPESQIFPAMNVLAQGIGVHCDYCHVRRDNKWIWDSEEKPAKHVGREMIRMMLELNRTKFKGDVALTCYSCHRGSTSVARVVPLPPRDPTKVPPPDPLPSAAELLQRLATATGDASKPLRMMGRLESASRTGSITIEVKPPQDVQLSFNGETKKADGALLDRARAIYAPDKVRVTAAALKVVRADRIGDREVWVANAGTTSYFFDKHSGLLLRRLETPEESMLGPLQEQADFDDYRDAGGVRMPFVITTSDGAPYTTAVRRFSEIR